jgi:hypothetical protein
MESTSVVQPSHWNNRLKAVAIGLIVALTALTVRHWYGTFMYGYPPCEDCRSDFPCFYAAAKLIWQSPAVLYDDASQLAIQKTIDPRIGDSILPFTYPPFTAVVYMPLGWLSFSAAFLAITLINVMLLAFSLRLLITRLQLTRQQSTWLILSGLCNFGVHSVLLQGQTSLIVLTLLAIFTAATQTDRQMGAGLSAGLMFVKPQLQAVPFIILLSRRWWRALVIASATAMALAIFSVVLVGWQAILEYMNLLNTYLTKERGYGSYPESMQNLRALAQYLVSYSWAPKLWFALIVPVVAAIFLLNAKLGTDPNIAAVQWIGNFIAAVLITPHFNAHDLAVLIIPTAFALKLFGDPVPSWLILLALAVGIYPLLALAFGNHLPPLVPVVLLVILFCCVRSVRRAVAHSVDRRPDAIVSM